jgi:hypothetical protein
MNRETQDALQLVRDHAQEYLPDPDTYRRAWMAVWAALSEVNPDWHRQDCSGAEAAVRTILQMGGKSIEPEVRILDRDATYKIVGVPFKTLRSYLASMPDDAMIMQDDGEHLELIVIQN